MDDVVCRLLCTILGFLLTIQLVNGKIDKKLSLLHEMFPHRNLSDFNDLPLEDFEEDFRSHLHDLKKMDDDQRRQGSLDEESQGMVKHWINYLETRMVEYLTTNIEEGEGGVFSIFYSLVTKKPCIKKLDPVCFGPDLGCVGSMLEHVCRRPEEPNKLYPEYRFFKKDNYKSFIAGSGRYPLQSRRFKEAIIPKSPIALIFHGFTGHPEEGREYLDIKDALLNSTNYEQVIMMNYSYAVRGHDYVRAMVNSEVVGRMIGNFLMDLRKTHGIKLADVYIIAFSMGCQVAHFTSQWVHEKTLGIERIGRISGLDPAAVLTLRYPDSQLSKDDAIFVDVIHSSAGFEDGLKVVSSFVFQRVGLIEPLGHVDFYPNGGSNHPQCRILDFPSCKHNQALIYYVNSITWCWYKSVPCSEIDVFVKRQDACIKGLSGKESVMGFYANFSKGRDYQYILTNKLWPHCLLKNNRE